MKLINEKPRNLIATEQIPEFKPRFAVANRYFQTIAGQLRRKYPSVPSTQLVSIESDENVELHGRLMTPPNAKARVVMFHGLGGCYDSHYMLGVGASLYERGFEVLAINLRGVSHPGAVLPYYYQAAFTQDLAAAIKWRKQLPTFVFACSYSGNMLIRLLSKQTLDVKAAVVSSAPACLGDSVKRLSRLPNYPFHAFFLKALYLAFRKKAQTFPKLFGPAMKPHHFTSLRNFDEYVTSPMHGYTGADDYYERHRIESHFKTIKTPMLIVHAKDDPMCSTKLMQQALSFAGPNIEPFFARHGGHAGFFDGRKSVDHSGFWLEQSIPTYFERFL